MYVYVYVYVYAVEFACLLSICYGSPRGGAVVRQEVPAHGQARLAVRARHLWLDVFCFILLVSLSCICMVLLFIITSFKKSSDRPA